MPNKPTVIVIVVCSEHKNPHGVIKELLDGFETNSKVGEEEMVVEPKAKLKQEACKSPRSGRSKSKGRRPRQMRKDSTIESAEITIGSNFELDHRGIVLIGPDGRRMNSDEDIDAYRNAWRDTP